MSRFKSQKKSISGPALTFSERKRLETLSFLAFGTKSRYKKILTTPKFPAGVSVYPTLEEVETAMNMIIEKKKEALNELREANERGSGRAQPSSAGETGEASEEVAGDQA